MKKYGVIALVVILAVVAAFALSGDPYASSYNDKYSDYKELSRYEVEGNDYVIRTSKTDSDVLVMAIHGGSIESGTTELAEQLAFQNGYSFYTLEGIKLKGNMDLHVTSVNFDEPKALRIASDISYTISLHGFDGEDKHTYVGGLDEKLATRVRGELNKAGFSAEDAPKGIRGHKPDNITNKNKRGKGVQIEISAGQRKAFFTNNDFRSGNRKNKTKEFYAFADAIQKAIAQ